LVIFLRYSLLHDALTKEMAKTDPWGDSLDKMFLCFSGEEFKYGKDQQEDIYLKMNSYTVGKALTSSTLSWHEKHFLMMIESPRWRPTESNLLRAIAAH
jgi:hypothetical protein